MVQRETSHGGGKRKGRFILRIVPFLLSMLILLGIIVYLAVALDGRISSEIIAYHEKEQRIFTSQLSLWLTEKLNHIQGDLAALAADPAITTQGEEEIRHRLRELYIHQEDFLTCVSYMDNQGVLRYVEGQDTSGEGITIRGQAHIKRLFENKGSVTSGSFSSVEGYAALSIDVPVLDGGVVQGAIGTLVKDDAFARWVHERKQGAGRYSLILDPAGYVIHCDKKGYTGKHVSAISLTAGEEGSLHPEFFHAHNYKKVHGSFFNGEAYSIACSPFSIGDDRYSFVSCAPYSDVTGSLSETWLLLGLLLFAAFVVALLGIGYILYLFLRDKRKSENFRMKIGREIAERALVEETLKKSEEQYRHLFHNMLDGVVVLETLYDENDLPVEFVCRNANESFSVHSGREPDFVMNRGVRDIFPGSDSEEWMQVCGSVALTGNPLRMEKYIPLFDRHFDLAIFKIDRRYLGLVFRNISDRREAQKALGKSEEKYRTILEDIEEAYFEADLAGNLTFFNKSLVKQLGFSKEELMGMNNRNYTSPETARTARDAFREILRTGASELLTDYEVICKDGTRRILEMSASLLSDERGKPSGFRGVTRDITERKEAEEALRASEAKYRSLASTADTMYLVDRECRYLFMNDEYRKRLGVELSEVIGQPYGERHSPEGTAGFEEKVATAFATGEPLMYDVKSHRDDKYFLRTLSPVKDDHGEIIAVTVVSKDITKRRLAEEKIRESLHEKEILLREIHHRVKNNLQIVTSLLSLQSRQVADTTLHSLLEKSKTRVRSMALIHERLCRSPNLSRVPFEEYVRSLTGSLLQVYGAGDHVTLAVDISPVILFELETAIPCGLIINELVSNALQHAFPGKREGRALIRMRPCEEEGMYELTVTDDGIGCPGIAGGGEFETLGMQLIHDLTNQLNGTVAFEAMDGTTCTILFRESYYRPRLSH